MLFSRISTSTMTKYIKTDQKGNKFYYSDKEMTIAHRSDGPAIEFANGTKVWYEYNQFLKLKPAKNKI